MSHTLHEDIHEHGLADDCPRCVEMAEAPYYNLDKTSMRDLVRRTLGNRYGGEDSWAGERIEPRSHTEAVAMATVMTALERAGNLISNEPDFVLDYLLHRWHVDLRVAPAPE